MKAIYPQEAEQSVLGSLMISPKVFDDIVELVEEKEFYLPQHQLIFRHISRLCEQGNAVDVLTVAESIERTGKLDKIGGIEFLGNIAHQVPSVANIKSYAGIVRKSYKDRAYTQAILDLSLPSHAGMEVHERIENAINILNSLADDKRDSVITWREATNSALESLEHRFANGGDIHGLKTGFLDFDNKTGGLHPGDLFILAGRPSMGKTAFATNIAENVALNNNPVLMFSLEMSSEQLANRTLASIGSINLNVIRSSKLCEDDFGKLSNAINRIQDAPLFIDPSPMMTATQMHIRARKLKRQHGLSLIVIDYLQLMTEGGDTRNNELSTITRKLKLMAKDLQVPVICLSQLSRKVEERADHRPMMSDLRDSGAIEQDADLIALMYREDYYNKETLNKGIAEVNIAKQRMGETGNVLLTFQGEFSRFKDFAGTYQKADKKINKRGFDDNKLKASGQ